MRNAQKKRVGDLVTQIDPVARGRTRRPPISAKIRKSHASAREAGQNTIKHSVARGREGKPQLTPQVINVPKIVPNTIMRKYFCSFTGTYYGKVVPPEWVRFLAKEQGPSA